MEPYASHLLMPATGVDEVLGCGNLYGFDGSALEPLSTDPTFESLGQPYLSDWDILPRLNSGQRIANGVLDTIPSQDRPILATDAVNIVSSNPWPLDQSVQSTECRCRVDIMLFPPRATKARKGRRLDTIFNVTAEMIKSCQDLIECESCDVGCADLLLMMTILQETSGCFEDIAKFDLDSATVKVSFGDYEVTSENVQFRAILVTDLVQRANVVLASISYKLRRKVEEMDCDATSDLARANIAYLETTIHHFRSVLRCVTDYVTTSTASSGSVIATT
ncbi:hypothetical protein F4678DRAFT_68862 [Xylaria arbuscula]|nr:hypothetical protein F4678DRAFT_68862 [Xylaria arbuscula]